MRKVIEEYLYIDFDNLSVFTDEFADIILKCMDCMEISVETHAVAGCAWSTPHFIKAVEGIDGMSTLEVSEGLVRWKGFSPASFSNIRLFKKDNPFKAANPDNFTVSFFFKAK